MSTATPKNSLNQSPRQTTDPPSLQLQTMANSFFRFKQFIVHQQQSAMKVTTDGCLFGAWIASECANKFLKNVKIPTVLDIGTGTGLLSLMLSQKLNCTIDAIEIDEDAYREAKENVHRSPWHNHINVILGDAKNMVSNNRYDIIISNPPFYENDLRSASSSKNKARHDESLLLPELLDIINENLLPTGNFFMLLPARRNKDLESLFSKAGLHINHKIFIHPSIANDPIRIMIKGQKAGDNTRSEMMENLAIRNEQGQYTDAFVNYLADYYLYL